MQHDEAGAHHGISLSSTTRQLMIDKSSTYHQETIKPSNINKPSIPPMPFAQEGSPA
jgi:hypothetical protein